VKFKVGWVQSSSGALDFRKPGRVKRLLQEFHFKIWACVQNPKCIYKSGKRFRADFSDDLLGFFIFGEPNRIVPGIKLAV
jgi:hypothetical protein